MSRSLGELVPWFRVKVEGFIEEARIVGIPLIVTRTVTDDVTQQAIWTIGRAALTPEQEARLRAEGLMPADLTRVKTNARFAHETPHGLKLAFDCVPKDSFGRPWWNAPDAVWKRLYQAAEKCGLDALGDPWGEFLSFDKGHFQEPGWRVFRRGG